MSKEAEQTGISKATAFLDALVTEVPDEVVQPPAPKPNDLGAPPQAGPGATGAGAPPQVPVKVPGRPAEGVPTPSLADAIRADRDARERASKAQAEAEQHKRRAEQVETSAGQYRVLAEISDPLEFARAKKFTPEEQALWGQALLYELKPEVAPPEFRLELYKAQQAREKRLEAEQRAKAEAEQVAEAERQQFEFYATSLRTAAQSFAPGSYPESEEWFTIENPQDPAGPPAFDSTTYGQSLFATARNMAEVATKAGRQVDLSPENVARVLNVEVQKRLARRDRVVAARNTKKQTSTTVESGVQSAVSPMSTQGLGSGGPRPPAKNEQERLERAAAVLFAPR